MTSSKGDAAAWLGSTAEAGTAPDFCGNAALAPGWPIEIEETFSRLWPLVPARVKPRASAGADRRPVHTLPIECATRSDTRGIPVWVRRVLRRTGPGDFLRTRSLRWRVLPARRETGIEGRAGLGAHPRGPRGSPPSP